MSLYPLGRIIALAALVAAIALAVDVALNGTPGLPLLMITAALVGTSAAWPVAMQQEARSAPPCMECGHASFASAELGFCAHCGSSRVWQAVHVVPSQAG